MATIDDDLDARIKSSEKYVNIFDKELGARYNAASKNRQTRVHNILRHICNDPRLNKENEIYTSALDYVNKFKKESMTEESIEAIYELDRKYNALCKLNMPVKAGFVTDYLDGLAGYIKACDFTDPKINSKRAGLVDMIIAVRTHKQYLDHLMMNSIDKLFTSEFKMKDEDKKRFVAYNTDQRAQYAAALEKPRQAADKPG